MDFLLSFRLFGSPIKSKPTKQYKNENVYLQRTPLIRFALLSVDSTSWIYLQIQGIIWRYNIAIYEFSFYEEEKDFVFQDYWSVALDLFFLVDLISAILYRSKWPKASKDIKATSSQLSRLVWRNELFKPRRIWMITVDIISLIPFQLYKYFFSYRSRVLDHLVPIIRLYRIPFYYAESTRRISLKGGAIFELLLKYAMFWIIITHSITCLWRWFSVSNAEFTAGIVLEKKITFDLNVPFQLYLVIFYFVQIAFTNIGFGDILPSTPMERVMTIITISLGFILLCGSLIASLSSAIERKARRVTTLRLRLSLMKTELEQRKVPESVSQKIMKFYHSLWVTRKGIGPYDEMLQTLPETLSSRVYFDIFSPALNSSLLFRSCNDFFKRAISNYMTIDLYMAGDVILKRSEINTKMFYIRKGTIQIMSYQDDETQIMTFGAGSVFGQIALLLSLPAKSEIHAATFCEIHLLSRRNLFKVLSDYPDAKEIILNAHKNLLLNVFADKFATPGSDNQKNAENVLSVSSFYKVPIETSRLARDDICVINTCPYIFEPDTIFLKVWNSVLSFVIVVICFYYPYCAAFTRKYPLDAEPFIIIVDLFLVLNIYLSFSTAFVSENILFSSIREITTTKIITLSTYIDIASVLPVHYFLDNSSRVKPLILCIRCLQIYKIPILFRSVEHTVDMTMIGVLRLIKYILYFLFGGYAMALIFYIQACYTEVCSSDSWYARNSVAQSTNTPVWVSLYAVILVMSGTGYGDVTPCCLMDVIFMVLFCLLGDLFYIYLISEYSASLSLNREPRENFTELANRVNSFLVSHQMLSSERIRVRQFLNLQWERNKGYEFTANKDLYYDTPKHLLFEASQFTRSSGIQDLELFKGMGEDTTSRILSSVCRTVFPPHEVVIYAGEVCNNLIIIEEGFCEVTYGNDISQKKIYGAGRDICTVELFLGLTSMCHVRTLTHCTIMKVPKTQLKRAFSLNPIAAKELDEYISEFKNTPLVQEVQKTRPVRLHLSVRSSIQKSVYRFRYFRKQGGNKELRDPYQKLGLCQWIRYILRSTTVLPYGNLLKVWEVSRCVFAFHSAMIFPLLPYFELQIPALNYIAIFLDITAWIDLYFRTHVCYYNKRKILVSHPLWTCGHYIKGSFVLDFIFSFPFDRIMFRPLYDSQGKALVSETPIDILRLLRVGQIYRVVTTVNNLGVDNLSSPSLFWVLVVTTAITAVFINFLASVLVLECINYKKTRDGSYEIVIQDQYQEHFYAILKLFHFSTKPFDIYLVNFYWIAVTAFNLGFGDITATTKELMIFVILVIVFSYLFFNYVTIIIASYLSSTNMNLTIYQKRMNHLVKYLKAENVEPILRRHIINHFEYIWKKTKGMQAQYVFINFNLALRDDVMLHLYEETLKGVSAFSKLDPSFFRILSSHLDEINFQAGAAIYKHGDILSDLYIIHKGEVTLVGENEDLTDVLGSSAVFGHLDNVLRGMVQKSAVATKNVTILKIRTVKFYQLYSGVHAIQDQQERNEELKLKERLLNSKEGTSKDPDDVANKFTSKRTGGIIGMTYKFSKEILIVYVVLSLFSANDVSYNLAFNPFNTYIFFLIIPTEILFIIKIFLGFFTGYLNEAGEFVSDLSRIKKRYMRITGFYLDFFTTVPFECFALAAPRDKQNYIMSWLRMTKLFRLYNVWYFFNLKFDTLNVNMVMLKIVAVAVWTATLLHQCCCLWYLISCPHDDCLTSDTWSSLPNGFDITYISCFYFVSAVITTTGFGDVTPHNVIEIFYVVILVFVAFNYTAIFIGQMVSTAQKSLFAKTNYEFQLEGLMSYLHVNDVSIDTQKAILRYVNNLWRNEKGQQIPELLIRAPSYLITEIKISTYGHHINENPLLRNCDPLFRKQLISRLIRTVFFPGDVIVYEGEVNRTTYFVHVGLVESNDSSKKLQTRIHDKNTFFGLRQGVHSRQPHKRTYSAKTLCIILSLNFLRWKFLKEFYPNDFQYIRAQAESYDID